MKGDREDEGIKDTQKRQTPLVQSQTTKERCSGKTSFFSPCVDTPPPPQSSRTQAQRSQRVVFSAHSPWSTIPVLSAQHSSSAALLFNPHAASDSPMQLSRCSASRSVSLDAVDRSRKLISCCGRRRVLGCVRVHAP